MAIVGLLNLELATLRKSGLRIILFGIEGRDAHQLFKTRLYESFEQLFPSWTIFRPFYGILRRHMHGMIIACATIGLNRFTPDSFASRPLQCRPSLPVTNQGFANYQGSLEAAMSTKSTSRPLRYSLSTSNARAGICNLPLQTNFRLSCFFHLSIRDSIQHCCPFTNMFYRSKVHETELFRGIAMILLLKLRGSLL
jgi:hypothetical protein